MKYWLRVTCAVLLAILWATPISAESPSLDGQVDETEYENEVTLASGDITVHWQLMEDSVVWAIGAPTGGWVSLGFEPTGRMKDADMILAWVDDDGMAHALDCYATDDYGTHPEDTTLGGTDDILQVAGQESDGRTTVEFSRPLATSDTYDRAIQPEATLSLIWAYGQSDEPTSRHTAAGLATLDLLGQSAVVSESVQPSLWPYHAGVQGLAFILMATGALIARYGRKRRGWLRKHRPLGAIGGGLALVGLLGGWASVELSGGIHLETPHAYLGIVLGVLVTLTPVLGFVLARVKPATGRRLRPVHRWLGRITVILMALQVVSGILMAFGLVPAL